MSSVSYTSSKSDSNKTNDNFDNDQVIIHTPKFKYNKKLIKFLFFLKNNSVNSSIDNTMIVEPTLVENEAISKSLESETKSQTEIVNTDKELEKKINFKNSLKEKKKKEKKLAFILSNLIFLLLRRQKKIYKSNKTKNKVFELK